MSLSENMNEATIEKLTKNNHCLLSSDEFNFRLSVARYLFLAGCEPVTDESSSQSQLRLAKQALNY